MEKTSTTSPASTGWFGNLTNSLTSVATAATPLVEASRGAKSSVTNASPTAADVAKARALTEKSTLSVKNKWMIAVAVLSLLIGIGAWLMFRGKGK